MANDERAARDAPFLADKSFNTPSICAAGNPDPAIFEQLLRQSLSDVAARRHELEARSPQGDHQITEETRNTILDLEALARDSKLTRTHGPNASWLKQGGEFGEVVINSPLL
jgi:hypothetical protein